MNAITFSILCITLFLNKSEATPFGKSPIKFDLNLIHTLSVKPTSHDNHPTTLPYIVKYQKGLKEVFYLSTQHTSDVNSKTHRYINRILREFAPQSVIVEIPGFNEYSLSRCEINKRCVEGPYAYLQAMGKGIEAVSGEPLDRDVFLNSMDLGMSEDEFIFFYTFRTVATWRANEPQRAYHPEDPDREISKYISGTMERLNIVSSNFDITKFKQIYKINMGLDFDYTKTGYEDIAPYYDGHAIQRMSVIIDRSREESILKTLEKKINEHSRVFIIYGSGHFLKHRPVLKKAFEREEILKP